MKTKPNILFIMCDQLRADALGCTGNWVKTPNIDRIAHEGVRFSNCVTNSPVC
ncbi:MAG: sulfatase, partial [Verrucomicrobia bacterium]